MSRRFCRFAFSSIFGRGSAACDAGVPSQVCIASPHVCVPPINQWNNFVLCNFRIKSGKKACLCGLKAFPPLSKCTFFPKERAKPTNGENFSLALRTCNYLSFCSEICTRWLMNVTLHWGCPWCLLLLWVPTVRAFGRWLPDFITAMDITAGNSCIFPAKVTTIWPGAAPIVIGVHSHEYEATRGLDILMPVETQHPHQFHL